MLTDGPSALVDNTPPTGHIILSVDGFPIDKRRPKYIDPMYDRHSPRTPRHPPPRAGTRLPMRIWPTGRQEVEYELPRPDFYEA